MLKPISSLGAVVAVTLFAVVSMMTPTSAAQYYDVKTRTWVEYTPSLKSRTKAVERKYKRSVVSYRSDEKPGTIIVDTKARYLYQVQKSGKAMRYGIGVGRDGFRWSGVERVTRKAEWPGWTPPPEMRKREAAKGRILPVHMKGGPDNPLGARALYLGSTIYRIHGTNEAWSIGHAVSSGCIRMLNSDVEHLYENVRLGTKVVVK